MAPLSSLQPHPAFDAQLYLILFQDFLQRWDNLDLHQTIYALDRYVAPRL